jgi:superfamily II DNA or RNA helicase
MKLRPYQSDAYAATRSAWEAGHRVVLLVLPTGSGKTVIFSQAIADHRGRAVAIAHRQELVGQISLSLARVGVYHRIIGPKQVVRLAVSAHVRELGRSYYSANADKAVAGVDTLTSRATALGPWLDGVTLWVQDEHHHQLRENKWGKAAALMPHARGLGVTATPMRADGRGLGRHADGLVDHMIVGPTGRELINQGYLSDYRIFAPTTQDLDLSRVAVSSTTGDYSRPQLRAAVKCSRIVGDVVEHYQRHAAGLLGITFATDTDTAAEIAEAYRAAGVPAQAVSHKTNDAARAAYIAQFRARQLLQLVNVDLFGEGFDVPGVECVSMARPTQSYAVYSQQFGRALRILPGKSHAVIIDHVGNVIRHGLPDGPRAWTLDRRERRARQDPSAIPLRTCTTCTAVYPRTGDVCPYCGDVYAPAQRSAPEHVDGDLVELDAATLARMRGDVARVDMTPEAYREQLVAERCPAVGQLANVKRHVERQEAQVELRETIAQWAGYHRAAGRTDSEGYRRFYWRFGVDVLTAQALGAKDAQALTERVRADWGQL